MAESLSSSETSGANLDLSFERLRRTTFWKFNACLVAFLLVQGIAPSHAYFNEQAVDPELAFAEQGIDNENALITANEDGFIFKIAGQSEQGNRKLMADIIDYEVQSGDSLSTIAQKFQVSQSTITQNNSIVNTHSLKVGQKLLIPPVDGVIHTVKENETLQKIAQKYKLDKIDTIIAQNKIADGSLLQVNQTLIIPGAKIEAPRDYIAYNRNITDNARGPSAAPDVAFSGNIKQGGFIKPANGIYTSRFGPGHYGIDIANRGKGPIFAAADGIVQKASYGWNGGYGNMITINHADLNASTLYGHNSELYVKPGDYVKQGQVIAWMGNSGRVYGATGLHLHFELAIDGKKRNPLSFF